MSKEVHYSTFLSSFTVNIIFVLLIIVGAAMIPLLSLQLNPTRYLPSITISYTWPETPARIAEQEVTTVLEGMLSTVSGIKKIASSTTTGRGQIRVEFDKKTDLRTKRFEIASLMREARKRLPEKVTYPVISMNMPSDQTGSTLLSYEINGNASTSYIYDLADKVIKPAVSLVDGVFGIEIYGATQQEWEVLFDQQKLYTLGISSASIRTSLDNYLLERELGGATEIEESGIEKRTYLVLKGNNAGTFKWDNIPVAIVAGRIVHLTDVAHITLKDQQPGSYYRINGLNTVNFRITAAKNVNNIKVADNVKNVIEKIKKELPPEYSIRLSNDTTIFLREEISKNIFRSVLSVILLLLFVLLISREFKYLLIISISLIANILIAFIFYYFFRIEIHLYSLAGITVSFGIIINNTIVMTDHLRFHKNKKVGISLVAATVTTIGALAVIFFLDEESRLNLTDFAAVVIINLIVSLAVALVFIPALVDKIKLTPRYNARIIKRKRKIVMLSGKYLKAIDFIIRYKIAFIILAILVFGLPVFYLPDSLPVTTYYQQKKDEELTKFQSIYNKTLGNKKYVQDLKPVVNKALGGTFRLFYEKAKNGRLYYSSDDEVQRTMLRVQIGLSEEGLTINDLNTTCAGLENMLAGYNEIDMFITRISSAQNANLEITFKPEHDFSIFPFILKVRIEDYMNGIGSYHASVSGVGRAFSNQVSSEYINLSYRIMMRGYNYDELYKFSEELKKRLIVRGKGRIKEVYLTGATQNNYNTRKIDRRKLSIDKYFLAENNSDVRFAHSEASKFSRSSSALNAYINGANTNVNIKSKQSEQYDYWSLNNAPIKTTSGQYLKLKDFSNLTYEISDNTISREDQQYIISVAYDFIGNSELGQNILKNNIEETSSLLPLGYTAQSSSYRYSWNEGSPNYFLIFLVILIIFLTCSILLESLRQPFVVISLIPFSFIGVFVTFHIFKISVDEGVFAAFILLCGIVVNATLYILNDYNSLRRRKPLLSERLAYVKAFNSKIIPIVLTKLSTIIGLIPFLLTGKDERFWFALAAGTIGGLVFSMIGLVVYQPMMMKKQGAGGRGLRAGS
ncbi:MAG TPA: efflux RND transporter permease subunit [Bacteroidales bacterium]|nr:efflux RND transporter permease subunit [Bacteroidales bacterium]